MEERIDSVEAFIEVKNQIMMLYHLIKKNNAIVVI